MALEKIGLAAIVKFDGQQAISGMKSVSQAAASMSQRISKVGSRMSSGLSSVGGGLAMTGLALAPLTAGIGFAGKAAADFEQQMDAVGAVARATAEEEAQLTEEAKRLGRTTVFTATQAGQAMEELARMGFDAKQTIGATSGVVNLAAADNMTLASSATIVAGTLSQFHLEASKANSVADVLALTSARTGTNVSKMAEGLKFAAPQAQRLGIDLETTSTMLGLLADNGIRGTLSGTAFKNALAKMVSPSKKGADMMRQYGIELATTADGSLDLVKTLHNYSAALSKLSKVQKAAAAKELLGERGQPLLAAFESGVSKKETDAQGNQVSKLEKLLGELQTQFMHGGSAAEMAARRLDNFHGAVTLLKSALEGLSIETFTSFLEPGKKTVQEMAKFVGQLVDALQILAKNADATDSEFGDIGKTAIAVARGISRGIRDIASAVEFAKNKFKEFIAQLGLEDNPEVLENFVRIATIIAVVGAAIGPVLIALGGLALVMGTVVVPAFTFAVDVIAALFSGTLGPVILGVAAAIGAILLVIDSARGKNESFGQAASRVWNGIKDTVSEVTGWISTEWTKLQERLAPFYTWIAGKWERFKEETGNDVKELVGTIVVAFEVLKPFFKALLAGLGHLFKLWGTIAGAAITGIMFALKGLISVLKTVVVFMVEGVVNALIAMAKVIVQAGKALGIDMNADLVAFSQQGLFTIDSVTAKLMAENAGGHPAGESNDILNDPNFVQGKPETREELVARLAKEDQIREENRTRQEARAEISLTLEDKRQLEIDNCVKLDGRKVAANQSKHQQEVNERRGFKATPWQKRLVVEQGASVSVGM